MKKILFAALGLLCLASCAKQPCCQLEHPCYSYDATIYELNTRQLTQEGTFKAAGAFQLCKADFSDLQMLLGDLLQTPG